MSFIYMRAVVFLGHSMLQKSYSETKVSMGQILIFVHKLAGYIWSSSVNAKLYLCH